MKSIQNKDRETCINSKRIQCFKSKDENNCEATPCFFIFKNTKNFFYFFKTFFFKKKVKKIFFYFLFLNSQKVWCYFTELCRGYIYFKSIDGVEL